MFAKLLSRARSIHSNLQKPSLRKQTKLLLERLEDRAVPASYTVDNLSNDVTVMNSLPWCITSAQNRPIADGNSTISFSPNLTGTISLMTPLQTLARITSITGPTDGSITIRRSAVAPMNFRIFTVGTGLVCSIENLRLELGKSDSGGGVYNSGNLTMKNVQVAGCTASQFGGGIFNAAGAQMTLEYVSVELNESMSHGGGIYNSGTLTMNSFNEVKTNKATRVGMGPEVNGGGLFNAGTAIINYQASFVENQALSNGGGIYNDNGCSLTMTGCLIKENMAVSKNGGGIYSLGQATITTCTFTLNSAVAGGAPGGTGGGFFIALGTATFMNCTFSGNMANVKNGGGWTAASTVNMQGNGGNQPVGDFGQV